MTLPYEVPSAYRLVIAASEGQREIVVDAETFEFKDGRWHANGEPVVVVGYEVAAWRPPT